MKKKNNKKIEMVTKTEKGTKSQRRGGGDIKKRQYIEYLESSN